MHADIAFKYLPLLNDFPISEVQYYTLTPPIYLIKLNVLLMHESDSERL